MAFSNLKPLSEDHERYKDTFENAFCKVIQKEVVIEKVTQVFEVNVMKKLTDVFGPDDEFSILGIGVGEGPYECRLLKSLQSHFSSICIIAVDPSEFMLNKFQERVATLKPRDESSVSCQLFNGPFSKFFAGSPLAKNKYNLITSMHSVYHLGDFETTFTQLTSMMKDNGFTCILCQKDDLMAKSFNKFRWLMERSQTQSWLSSNIIKEFAESLGYDVISSEIVVQWDITEVFDDQSDFGNKLLDFFTQLAYFRQTAPSELVDELMNFWRSVSTEDENGRIFASSYEEILLISN